jgi:hypothetical protein
MKSQNLYCALLFTFFLNISLCIAQQDSVRKNEIAFGIGLKILNR